MGAAQIDFAVFGNAPAAIGSLRQTIAAMPDVRLVKCYEIAPSRAGHGIRTGIVVDTLAPFREGKAGAQRLALVLEDPVRVSLSAQPGTDRPATGYAEQLRQLLVSAGERALIVTTDELRSPACVRELLHHLQLDGDEFPALPGWSAGVEPLSPGRRALGFGRVRDDIEEVERLAGRTFPGWRFGPEPEVEPSSGVDRTMLAYVGRDTDSVTPREWLSLDDWDVLPVALGPLLDDAEHLAVLDPLSFPFDAMRAVDWEIPLSVRLPGGWDGESLLQLLGGPLLRQLTPLDRVAVDDDAVWERLRQRFGWPLTIRVPPAELTETRGPDGGSSRDQKMLYRELRRLVRSQLEVARELVPPAEHPNVLLMADAVGLWASLASFPEMDLLGVSDDAHEREQAAGAFPEWTFAADLPRRPEAAETVLIAVCLFALCERSEDERRRRLEGIAHVVRIGGTVILVDRFLRGAGGTSIGATSPRQLLAEVQQAWGRDVALEHVETLRLPGDDLTSIGMFTVTKLGRPRRP